MIRRLIYVVLVVLLPVSALAADAVEIMKKSQAVFLYQGGNFKARVVMKLTTKGGQERTRELTMLRKNYGEPGGNQKYFLYFFKPSDVRDMTFMVYKYPAKDDDRWIFVPSINLVQRIAASDKRSSFVGSDFTYEDVSGRDIIADEHKLVKEEACDGSECYVIESKPSGGADYSKKVSWIDKASFLPIKEEYYNVQGEIYRLFSADEVTDVQGHPTITKRTMKNLKSGHRTEVTFGGVKYDVGIKDDLFSERYLKNPPKELIQ
jgi:outer membrane lipoprotein-sorting protein